MEYLVTAREMQELDRTTIEEVGIPALVLMERAALAVCEEIIKRSLSENRGISATMCMKTDTAISIHEKCKRVLILCGCGNNGADGLALARMLSEKDYDVQVVVCGNQDKATKQWKVQYKILQHYPVDMIGMTDFLEENFSQDTCSKNRLTEYDILVDSIFGVGLCREISDEFAQMIAFFNQAVGYKVAVDVPSGIHSDTGRILGCAVKADLTVCFAYAKRGLLFYPGCEYAGEVLIKDIGIGEKAMIHLKPQMFRYTENPAKLLPVRDESGNKGTFGKVLIAAGRRNMAGAAVLAANSCYRTGAGMVKVLTEECNREILQIAVPEALFTIWPDESDKKQITGEGTSIDVSTNMSTELFTWPNVLAVGPGMGTDQRAYDIVKAFLEKTDLPLVVDADGLNLIAMHRELADIVKTQGEAGRTIILTPHAGELSRLTGHSISDIKEAPVEIAMGLAKELKCVIVSKDARTLVCCEGKPICMNTAGNSGMATAGSGDVLSGIITGLLAQGMDGFAAAAVGVYIHGLAGDAAAKKLGRHGMMAGDIVEAISEVIR